MLCELACVGEAQTKYEEIKIAKKLIRQTKHAGAFIKICEKRNIRKNWDNQIVGKRWYCNFMNCYRHHLKRAKFKIMDSYRKSYCMYDSIYKNVVEAEVAIKLESEQMFGVNGNITTNEKEMYGRPSRYQLIKPEWCVFVGETGCNTNCKNDGLVGGQRHIDGSKQVEGARTSASTDLHFTVLAFTSGTGEATMCAIILKSDKKIEDIPVNWKLGIDVTKNMVSGETNVESYSININNGVMTGGPTCRFNGKELPCFACVSPNASITSELLAQMLEQIDSFNVILRSREEGVPFLW
jgi:hypothetical protein